MGNGLVYIFTGNGKGKTSAAVGTAVRAVAAGMKVAWVAWYKQASWNIGEVQILKKIGVEMLLLGKGFHIASGEQVKETQVKTARVGAAGVVVDSASSAEHRAAAQAALASATELLGKVDVLVLDEVNNAVHDSLVDVGQLKTLISKRGSTHLVLTGRDAHEEIVKMADLVTEMNKVKHPYDKGALAVRGLDF